MLIRIAKVIAAVALFSLLAPSASMADGRRAYFEVDPRTYLQENPTELDDNGWICIDCVYRITGVRDGDSFYFDIPFVPTRILYYGKQDHGYLAELIDGNGSPVAIALEGDFWAPAIGREWQPGVGTSARLYITMSENSFIGVANGYNFETARLGITTVDGAGWMLFQFSSEGVWQGSDSSTPRDFRASFLIQRAQDECLLDLHNGLKAKQAQELAKYELCGFTFVDKRNYQYLNESLISDLPAISNLISESETRLEKQASLVKFIREFNTDSKSRRALIPALYKAAGIKGLDGANKTWIVNRLNEAAPFPSTLNQIQDLVYVFQAKYEKRQAERFQR